MNTVIRDFILSDKDKYALRLKNHFLFLLPVLAWNIVFAPNLPIDYSGNASVQWMIFENIFRYLSILYPVFLPINTKQKYFKQGFITYVVGVLLYFGSWIWIIYFSEPAILQSLVMRLAPAYLPMIWFTGISMMEGSKIQFLFSVVFIGLHLSKFMV